MLHKNVTIGDTVDFLNELLRLDPDCVNSLCDFRVTCNEHVAKHPTVQVIIAEGEYRVGLLGILNGLFCSDDFKLAAFYDDDGNIDHFGYYE